MANISRESDVNNSKSSFLALNEADSIPSNGEKLVIRLELAKLEIILIWYNGPVPVSLPEKNTELEYHIMLNLK
jgi:hypothetical protein